MLLVGDKNVKCIVNIKVVHMRHGKLKLKKKEFKER